MILIPIFNYLFWPHTCKRIQTGANASVHLKTIILLYALVRLKSGLQKIRTFGFSENRTYPKNPDLYDLTEQKFWVGAKMIVFKNRNGRYTKLCLIRYKLYQSKGHSK